METVPVVAGIIEREGRVLALRRAVEPLGDGWGFADARVMPEETGEEALGRLLRDELCVRPLSIWPYDTLSCDYPDFTVQMECLVCHLAPGVEPRLDGCEEARWVGPGELPSLEWLPADLRLAQRLGVFWDDTFAATHL